METISKNTEISFIWYKISIFLFFLFFKISIVIVKTLAKSGF